MHIGHSIVSDFPLLARWNGEGLGSRVETPTTGNGHGLGGRVGGASRTTEIIHCPQICGGVVDNVDKVVLSVLSSLISFNF